MIHHNGVCIKVIEKLGVTHALLSDRSYTTKRRNCNTTILCCVLDKTVMECFRMRPLMLCQTLLTPQDLEWLCYGCTTFASSAITTKRCFSMYTYVSASG
jgi:hypothetical protein